MEKDLIDLLQGIPGLSDLLQDRVVFGRRADDGYPYLSMFVAGQEEPYAYSGSINLYFTRVQMDFIGSSYGQAVSVEKLVSDHLRSVSFPVVVGDTEFIHIQFISRFGDTEELGVANETLERISRDVSITWKEVE